MVVLAHDDMVSSRNHLILYNKRYTCESAGQSLTRIHVSEQLQQTEEAKKSAEGMSDLPVS